MNKYPEEPRPASPERKDLMIAYVTGADGGFESLDLSAAARSALLKIGMTESAVDALKGKLTAG